MEISHRVSFNKYSDIEKDLDDLGIEYKKITLPGDNYTIHFDIKESDTVWSNIQNLIKNKQFGSSIAITLYSNEEIINADFCVAIPSFETEYPYPEKSWQQEKHTHYESYCNKCGVYSNQSKPYRISKEPNLKKHGFMTLTWGNLSIFATPSVFTLFKEEILSGYEMLPVYIKEIDTTCSIISQLQITNSSKQGLIPNADVKSYKCPACNTLKYNYPKRGTIMYKLDRLNNTDFQFTSEWFGDGLVAYHLPIFSKRAVKLILDHGFTGLQFKPLLLQESEI